MDDELDGFKKINLEEFILNYGFKKDAEKSSVNNPVLTNGAMKIILKKHADDRWTFWDVLDEKNKGTIIDFCLNNIETNMGKVRKILREYQQNKPQTTTINNKTETETGYNKQKIEWVIKEIKTEEFKDDYRHVKKELLNQAIKDGRILLKDNCIYVKLYDLNGVCGLEKIDMLEAKKRIIANSKKGIWAFGNLAKIEKISVFESWLDGLSFVQMYGDAGGILSIEGTTNTENLLEILRGILIKNTNIKEINLALDNDEAGDKLTIRFLKALEELEEVFKINIKMLKPITKDYNADLEAIENNKKKEVKREGGLRPF